MNSNIKKIPRDIEYFDEHGSRVINKIQHEDNPNDSCNDFYPIRCQQGNDEKVLKLQNDDETYTLNSLTNEFPILSIQSAADCFRMGKAINQFRRLYSPLASPVTLDNDSDRTYSSMSSLETEEEDHKEAHPQVSGNKQHKQMKVDEGDLIFEENINRDHYRLCKAKLAQDTVLGKFDTSLTKKALTATEAPHLDTKALIAKLDEVSKVVDLDVSTILAEQIKDPVLGIVRSWIRKGNLPDVKTPEIQQSKGLLRYCQERDQLPIKQKVSYFVIMNL